MKRKPQLTKREKKALAGGPRPAQPPKAREHDHDHQHQHIHCVACGRHLDAAEFDAPATATFITCQHGSNFPSCVKCATKSKALIDEHDRTGNQIQAASAWH